MLSSHVSSYPSSIWFTCINTTYKCDRTRKSIHVNSNYN